MAQGSIETPGKLVRHLTISTGNYYTGENGLSENGISICVQNMFNDIVASGNLAKWDIVFFSNAFNLGQWFGIITMATETVGFFMITQNRVGTIVKGRVAYGGTDCTDWNVIS